MTSGPTGPDWTVLDGTGRVCVYLFLCLHCRPFMSVEAELASGQWNYSTGRANYLWS